MSRRTLALVLGLAVAGGVAIYVIARGGGGSTTPTATASPSPSTVTEERSASPSRPGPQLESPGSSTEPARSAEAADVPRPQVPPEMQARVAALAGAKAPAPASGTAIAQTSRTMPDKAELETQRARALDVLAKQPGDVDATRVMVSTSCAMNDVKTARKYNASLPAGDRADMARACGDLGVKLAEDPRWDTTKPAVVPPVKQRPPT
jgi:hypothetical protein